MAESKLCEKQIDLMMATRKFSLFDSSDSSESIAAPRKTPANANSDEIFLRGQKYSKVLRPSKSK